MTKTMTRPPRAALDPTTTEIRGNLRTGKRETWAAGTLDQVWSFDRVEIGDTPWEITHRPTGVMLGGVSLQHCQEIAAAPNTLAGMAADARAMIARGGKSGVVTFTLPGQPKPDQARELAEQAARAARASRVLGVLEGRIGACAPVALCECGGMLTGDGFGALVHADACTQCARDNLAYRRRCPLIERHAPCPSPAPIQCDHRWCVADAVPLGGDYCRRGRDWCCGDCCRP